jgi:propionate CoA-transferase
LRAAVDRLPPLALSADKVIQRRAFMELLALDRPIVNLGIGIPAGIGRIAGEEGFDGFTMTVESGVIGGTPAEELSFGAAVNPSAVIPQASQFDFYDGGGLDIAFLGMAEVDLRGAVNVSRFGTSIVGVGGFTNISQTAGRVVYVGSFSSGGAEIAVRDGKLAIDRDGRFCKIVERVAQVSSDPAAAPPSQQQMVVTERAVFRLNEGRLTLTETAPGIDVRADILERLPQGVAIADRLATMDARLFTAGAMKDFA